MAKRLTYQVGFTADTSQLQATVQQAVQSLSQLSFAGNNQLTAELQAASAAASQLGVNLQNAFNVSTGKLDLIDFNRNLAQSQMTLTDYYNQLSRLGPEGQQAFLQVAQAITSAEMPLRRSNALMEQLWVTMKNTMRWQLTSSALHGFVGGVQTAYGYAQDLNESLNNIRIVTNKSTGDMRAFAEQANKAAQALSTTTTEYTNASLIYYQQGLTDSQVEERTDATIKFANVSRQSAEIASEQLTSIWNNFDDGTKSLEYYIDVMVKLGAATASSSEEISQGVQKFAATADTIGLSYEYAAAALATVTATTRQSADIVGTAFKTLFARIQDLKLGETLEDGTTLGTYSDALYRVGINIKDANGQLKDMDILLEELGNKWNMISKDQQVALAQQVAGVRQYTQLMALMENWDFFQENLSTAYGSEGELERQALIYAESWEAARDRVSAAAENIYDSIINDQMFIDLDNALVPLLNRIADIVDALGGLKGMASLAGYAMTSIYGDKMVSGLRALATNVGLVTGSVQREMRALQSETAQLAEQMTALVFDSNDIVLNSKINILNEEVRLRNIINERIDDMNEDEQRYVRGQLQEIENLKNIVSLMTTAAERSQAQSRTATNRLSGNDFQGVQVTRQPGQNYSVVDGVAGLNIADTNNLVRIITDMNRVTNEAVRSFNSLMNTGNGALTTIRTRLDEIATRRARLEELRRGFEAVNGDVTQLTPAIEALGNSLYDDLSAVTINNISTAITDCESHIELLTNALRGMAAGTGEQMRETRRHVDDMGDALQSAATDAARLEVATGTVNERIGQTGERISNLNIGTQDWATQLVNVSNRLMQVAMAIQAIQTLDDIWSDEDISTAEKLTQTLTSLTMILPVAVTTLQLLIPSLQGMTLAEMGTAAATAFLSSSFAAQIPFITANAAAWYAHPIMWIAAIIAGVIAAIALLGVGISRLTEYIVHGNRVATEGCEQLIKNAEATRELANANEELSSSIDDLVVEYDRLNAIQEDSSDVLMDIQNKMPSLIDSYKEFAKALYSDGDALDSFLEKVDRLEATGNLAALTGDYSDFTTQKAEIDTALAVGTARQNQQSAQAASKLLVAGLREAGGKVSGDQFSVQVGGIQTRGEERKAKIALRDQMGDYYSEANGLFKYGAKLTLDDASSPTAVVDYYEKLQAARDEMLSSMTAEEIEASDIFREVNKLLVDNASAYETAKIEADAYLDSVADALKFSAGRAEDIASMEEFLQYKQEYLELAQSTYGLSEDQAEAIFTEAAAVSELGKQYQLATAMAKKFGGVDVNSPAFKESADSFYKQFASQLDSQNLTALELDAAINLVATSDSLKEFAEQYQMVMIQATAQGYEQSAELAKKAMQEAVESGSFDFASLFADENFNTYLEEINASQVELTATSYEEQYAIVSKYYSRLSSLAFDAITAQQELYYQQAADAQNELSAYYKAMESDSKEAIISQKEEYANLKTELGATTDETEIERINDQLEEMARKFEEDYGFEITTNADTIQSEIDRILTSIEELQNKKIEMAMDWSGVDEVENGLKSIAEFAKLIAKDTKKVGNTYELTAAQARKWLEFYPELGAIAETTNEGIIQMDAARVDAFIKGKDAEIDNSIEAKIIELDAQKTVLEEDLKLKQKDAEAAKALLEGKMNNEEVSAKYLVNLRKNLTDYFIDSGLDEVAANKAALETMNMNEQEYSEAVADACETNAQNVAYAAEDGANAQGDALTQMVERWRNFGTYLLENIGPLLRDIGAAILDPTKTVADVMRDAWDASAITVNTDGSHTYRGNDNNYSFNAGDETQRNAVYQAIAQAQLDSVDAEISAIIGAINSIDGQIDYLRALQNQDLSEYGSTDPDKTSKNNKEIAKQLQDILERYHEITREIEYQERALNKLEQQIERTYGLERLELYAQKISKLSRIAELRQQKAMAALGFAAADEQSIRDLGLNPEIDKDTLDITNYTALLEQARAEYNQYMVSYNQLTKEQQDAAEAEKTAVEELYEKRIQALETYEESVDTYREEIEAMEDVLRQIEDAKLDEITYKLEVVIDAKEAQRAAKEFSKAIVESFGDKLTHTLGSAKIGYDQALMEQGMYDDYLEQYNALKKRMSEANEYTDTTAIVEAMKELQSNIIGSGESLLEWIETVETMLPDAIDAARERFNLFTDQLAHNSAILDTVKELLTLQGYTYKTMEGFSALQKATKEQMDASLANAELNKAWFENARIELLRAEEALAGVTETDAAYDTLKNNRDALLAEYNEAQAAMLESAKEAMQAAQEMYTTAVEKAAYDFNQAVSGGMGLDLLQSKYDHFIEEGDRYLDAVNEAYEVSAWYNKLQADIDKSTNSAHKERLKELQEEIDIRREGNTLSEYDLNILEAKYKVLQAQIALEDAQNAKNDLRLVRDSQGNWNYQYTADQGQIAEAKNQLLEADNEWYNLAKQQVEDVTGEIISTWKECEEELKAIYSDMTLTDEERAQRAQEIYDYYTEKVKYLEEEKQNAIKDMNEAGNKALLDNAILTGDAVADITGITSEDLQRIIEEGGTSILELLTADSDKIKELLGDNTKLLNLYDTSYGDTLNTMTGNTENFEQKLSDAIDSMNQAFEEYGNNVGNVADTTGTKYEDLRDIIDTVSDSTDNCRDAGLSATEAMWDSISAIQTASMEYAMLTSEIMATVAALEALAAAQAVDIETYSGTNVTIPEEPPVPTPPQEEPTVETPTPTVPPQEEEQQESPTISHNEMVQLVYDMGVGNYDNNPIRKGIVEGKYPGLFDVAQAILNEAIATDNYNYHHNGNKWKQTISALASKYGYETGGYTGEFQDAKLAFLHEKELILNKQDTANILSAVSAVRTLGPELFAQIERLLDSSAGASAALMADRLSSGPSVSVDGGTVEQLVRIEHVEFPNVTSSDEISDAFASLVNDAAQWAQRRKS